MFSAICRVAALLVRVARACCDLLAQVILRGVAQLLHQAGDLVLARAVAHRLAEPLLRGAHPLQRVADIAVLQQDGEIPQRLRDLVLRLVVRPPAG